MKKASESESFMSLLPETKQYCCYMMNHGHNPDLTWTHYLWDSRHKLNQLLSSLWVLFWQILIRSYCIIIFTCQYLAWNFKKKCNFSFCQQVNIKFLILISPKLTMEIVPKMEDGQVGKLWVMRKENSGKFECFTAGKVVFSLPVRSTLSSDWVPVLLSLHAWSCVVGAVYLG